MAKRATPATPATSTATPATPATATPKFRNIDAEQFLLHAKKMDSIHTAKSTTRKFAGFVNLTVSDIAVLLADAEIENVNQFINLAVNGKTADGIRKFIADGTVSANIVRKK
jgi:hypothetical protein